ncbi:PREDICTED: transcription elongation factor A protein 2 [Nanorana parkeri]|uniref:transcription elongation factor A protein 2 n=1 Tax=Nanorana parkeri TaxID=125878 RepID=UPI0008542A08|nr:PREDICTED: transcription elongation factor A protein 2 [Nanorana parkeri]
MAAPEVEEVLRIARKLDKMVSKKSMDGALDLLKQLKNMMMSLDLLQSTRIGMSVNALRKQSNDEDVITLSKSLIKSWKKLLDGSDQRGKERRRSSSSSKDSRYPCYSSYFSRCPERWQSPEDLCFRCALTTVTGPPVAHIGIPGFRSAVLKVKEEYSGTDTLELTPYDRGDHIAIGSDCELLAAQIEEVVFGEVQNTDMKYKNRIRSRIANLKDSKNPDLRKNVLCGAITPEQIAIMTCEEMASNELKEMRKAMTKAAIQEHQMGKTGGTQTDLFSCGKCKKKNCTYTQVQTRSADEPMTTFVVCNECGNRWKFC